MKSYWTGKVVLNNSQFLLFFILIIALSLGRVNIARAQASPLPPLERIITINLNNEPTDAALQKISQLGKFTFSYSPDVIGGIKSVTINVKKVTVREVLNKIFSNTVTYKEKSNYIILKKAPASERYQSSPMNISGYVINDETGEKISAVSVYDKNTLSAAVTNQFGYFKIIINKPSADAKLFVGKRNYRDTVLTLSKAVTSKYFLTIPLHPEKISAMPFHDLYNDKEDTLEKRTLSEQEINMLNIKDTIFREAQVSFLPFVGTNQKLSGNVVNDFSFNILGGYSMGTQSLELGGLFNIDRSDVSVVQLAGLFNLVGGTVTGLQMAGLINADQHNFKGAQFAGLINAVGDTVQGAQFAGLINTNTKMSPQFMAAGLVNITGQTSKGVQLAGLVNVQAGSLKGAQIAGLINTTTNRIEGVQIAGLVNYATKMKGSQIGFLNVADSLTGASVGFFSFVVHGYHKIELSADEVFYTNIAFRTGTRYFYNIFTAGIKPDDLNTPYWTVGYGIGTAPPLSKKLSLNIDIIANWVSKGAFSEHLNLSNKAYVGIDWQFAKNVSLTIGPTFNVYLTDTNYEPYPPLFTDYQPHLVIDHTYPDGINMKGWFGLKAGIRFL